MAVFAMPITGYKSAALVILLARESRMSWEVVCFGPKRHYRGDGSCEHTDTIYQHLRSDWHRSRTHLIPRGNEKKSKEE